MNGEDTKGTMSMMFGIMMIAIMASVLTGTSGAQAGTTKAHVVVNTTPSGATVVFGSTTVGVSPITVELDAGTYSIQLVLAGYNTVTTSVAIAAGETRTLNVTMTEVGGAWTPIDIVWS